jgi:pimeloyl-ACP methyl ester carboxylesterase
MRDFTPRLERGSGRPILLLHGWAVDARFFAPQMVLAERGFRVIAPDLPGHAPEAAPGAARDAAPTITALADALEAFLAARALTEVTLAGWSMGGAVALDHLARYGTGRIARLVLLDMAPKVANDSDWRCGLANGQGRADMLRMADKLPRSWPKAATRIARSCFPLGAAPAPELLARYEAIIARKDPALMAALWRSLADFDARAVIPRLAIPLSVVLGAASPVYPPALDAWYRKFGSVGVHRLSGAGHAVQLDAPEAVNAILAGAA